MSHHAKYGGSTAVRTMNCTAWQHLSEGMPESPASPAALLGTALHHVIEKCLLDEELDPYTFAGQTIEDVPITKEHITEKIFPALDEFENLMDQYAVDQYWVEEWVEVSNDIAGTADFIGLSADGKTIVVADYKSGDGHMVYAEKNHQGLFYAMCARHKIFKKLFADAERLVIAIVQPSHRREHYLDVWETDLEELEQFTIEHEGAVAQSERGNGEPCIGEWCAWCPAEAKCPAKLNEVAKVEERVPDSMLAADVSEWLEIADKVESWSKAVRKTAHDLLSKGVPVKDWKLVDKRATRVWNDVEAVEQKVKLARKLKSEDAYEYKLKSPAQLEKVCLSQGIDWDSYETFISAVSSGTTLARAHDPRQAVVISETQKLIAERFAQ